LHISKKIKNSGYLEYKPQAINRVVLKKAIKERPDCVDYIETLTNTYEKPYIEKSQDFLRNCRSVYRDWLNDLESSKEPGLSSSELDEIAGTIKMCENILDFIDDLEKIGRLFKKKGIETSYSEILSIFSEVIEEKLNKEYSAAIQEIDKILDSIHKGFSIKLGEDITRENVIKEFMKKYHELDESIWVPRLLDKFDFEYKQDEVEKLIEKIKEEIEIEEFEQNLGAAQQKQKNEIGDFTQLNGYEFEEYLKKLFELLGYTAVQTPSSGDQGADLILSKDDVKIVVQAKKYGGKVSNKAVQEIAAAKNYYDADRAMIVTNSSFTKSAIELAFSNDVELWDGRRLKNIIKDLENKSEESGFFFENPLTFKEGEEVQNITMRCPCCEKEFDYQVNVAEEGTYLEAGTTHELEIKCPYCGLPIGISLDVPLKPWRCRSCGKKFETKAAAKEHEQECEDRKR
jgi:HJR/Mrr/RecB family endonuclease